MICAFEPIDGRPRVCSCAGRGPDRACDFAVGGRVCMTPLCSGCVVVDFDGRDLCPTHAAYEGLR